jgi:hypothetical protein
MITSFVVDEIDTPCGTVEVVTTYVSSSSRYHYICLHWTSETQIAHSGLVGDGKLAFLELIVNIWPFRKHWAKVLVGGSWQEIEGV